MRLSTVILPVRRWSEGGRERWQRAEQLGFHTAYTYDHLTWRVPFRDGPWFGAVPTLTAAAATTSRLRLGTLVTSPNFRHPVPLAKDLITLDDLSDGRLTLGIGAGGSGFDATVLGGQPWTPRERADRFAEFVPLLHRLLTEDEVSAEGTYYTAHEARGLRLCRLLVWSCSPHDDRGCHVAPNRSGSDLPHQTGHNRSERFMSAVLPRFGKERPSWPLTRATSPTVA